MKRWILGVMAALALTLSVPTQQSQARDLYFVGDLVIWIGSDWGPPPPPIPGTRWVQTASYVYILIPGY